MSTGSARNVVLVHGGFVDGSGWQGVHDLLTADGYRVAIVQNPTLSLEDDAAATRLVIDGLDGPVVLVGHSYGGAVITEAGNHEKVPPWRTSPRSRPTRASRSTRSSPVSRPTGRSRPSCRPGTASSSWTGTNSTPPSPVTCPAAQAAFMADSQVPWGVNALGGTISEAAWRMKPSWYLLTTEDRMIPPPAQHAMAERTGAAVIEVSASHSVYVSQPQAVASLIKQAAG